jgi:hypothetical protein
MKIISEVCTPVARCIPNILDMVLENIKKALAYKLNMATTMVV